MLTTQQLACFSTFGFLVLPRFFMADEMTAIIRAAEEVWKEDPEPEKNGERRLDYFVERRPLLTRLVADERIYSVIEALMGPEFIWVGSEGNISTRTEVNWHPDRKYYRSGEEQWVNYPQMKVMLYLQKVTKDTGCLRVISGSHTMPYHKDLADQEIDHDQVAVELEFARFGDGIHDARNRPKIKLRNFPVGVLRLEITVQLKVVGVHQIGLAAVLGFLAIGHHANGDCARSHIVWH